MPQLDIFGNYGDPATPERAPEPLVRQLVAFGCDPELAAGYSRKQAHAVLRKLKEKAERERQAMTPTASPARARPAPAEWEESPARAGEDEPVEYAEPLAWHRWPWDRPDIDTVIEQLAEMRRMPPEVVLPRCVFWSIRHLPPAALVRLIDWLREELTDARERRTPAPGVARTGGDTAAGGDERLAGGGGRGRDAPPHIADAGTRLARHADEETDREPEPADSPADEW